MWPGAAVRRVRPCAAQVHTKHSVQRAGPTANGALLKVFGTVISAAYRIRVPHINTSYSMCDMCSSALRDRTWRGPTATRDSRRTEPTCRSRTSHERSGASLSRACSAADGAASERLIRVGLGEVDPLFGAVHHEAVLDERPTVEDPLACDGRVPPRLPSRPAHTNSRARLKVG